jgi:DNA repair protein RadD
LPVFSRCGNKADQIGHVDLVLIDECHLVSHKQEGGYRKLIDDLMRVNPALRVIGLTATPYRLGHGYITDEPALFADIISPVGIEELIYKKFLAPLRSKVDGAPAFGGGCTSTRRRIYRQRTASRR